MTTSFIFSSKIFQNQIPSTRAAHTEQVVKGGRHLFPLLPKASTASSRSASSAGARRARPRRRTCATRSKAPTSRSRSACAPGSSSMDEAREAGFTEENGTLGEMFEVVAESDLVLLLISDAAQAELFEQVLRGHHARRRRSACRTASCSAT